MTKDFIRLLIIAFVIAIPLANYFMKDWLKIYIYKIEINAWLFALPGLIVILVALITIWGQSIKAAQANPVDAIRGE